MSFFELALLLVGCLGVNGGGDACNITQTAQASEGRHAQVAGIVSGPEMKDGVVDVELTAKSVIVWDVDSGKIIYEKNARDKRPIASLSKLLSALVVRQGLPMDTEIEVTENVRQAQAKGVDVQLPVGEHVKARDLLTAGMVASANDAMTALAEGYSGSEDNFAHDATLYAKSIGVVNTKLANATGLSGGEQYSTAEDVMKLLSLAYDDGELREMLSSADGSFTTREGSVRKFRTTNELLKSYLPILAAKTGYTYEAGENLAIITQDESGHKIGAVVLGSEERFQDMKVLIEWINRNFVWKESV